MLQRVILSLSSTSVTKEQQFEGKDTVFAVYQLDWILNFIAQDAFNSPDSEVGFMVLVNILVEQ